MKADEIVKLVKMTDSLVYEQTGQHLLAVEEEILRQALIGSENSSIKFPGFEDSYVQRGCAPKLWKKLSAVVGQKVHKRNVRKILQKLQLQQEQSLAVTLSRRSANARTDLNDHSAQNRCSSYLQGSYKLNPGSTYQYSHAHHSCQGCSTHLLPQHRNEQQSEPSAVEHPQPKIVSDALPDSTTNEFQSSDHTSSNDDTNKTSSHALPKFINFRQSGIPLLFSIGILSCLCGLSWLANWYGLINHLDGQLPQAQLGYKIALKLNPLSAEAHYNRGAAYEDEQNYQRAHNEYQLAIEGGLVEAYNNQARLYILEGNYDAAVSLLRIGLPLAQDTRVRADMYKNQGWARLGQRRYAKAKLDLSAAIQLKSDRAPAYCLLAQVLEHEADKKGALEYWRKCLGFSYQPETPEEDKWVELASQRLSPRRGRE